VKKEYLIFALVVCIALVAFVVQSRNKISVVPNAPTIDTQDYNSKGDTVIYKDSGFEPNSLKVAVGTTMTFIDESGNTMWVGSDPHPVHTDHSSFDQLKTGDSYSFTFTKIGIYKYHNHMFPTHSGVITVE
jgi:plastocyanin